LTKSVFQQFVNGGGCFCPVRFYAFLRFVGKRAEIGRFSASAFLPVFGLFLAETVAVLPFLHYDRSARIALGFELREPIFP